jgi:hypothetical protein
VGTVRKKERFQVEIVEVLLDYVKQRFGCLIHGIPIQEVRYLIYQFIDKIVERLVLCYPPMQPNRTYQRRWAMA